MSARGQSGNPVDNFSRGIDVAGAQEQGEQPSISKTFCSIWFKKIYIKNINKIK